MIDNIICRLVLAEKAMQERKSIEIAFNEIIGDGVKIYNSIYDILLIMQWLL